MADEIEFWRCDEWTMVYLNGELVKYGDHYLAEEWLQERCGVKVVDDPWGDSLTDGGRSAHKRLFDAEKAKSVRLDKFKQAADMRRRAQQLLEDAAILEGKK